MGFASNQWLNRGQGLRQKGHRPVAVAVSCEVASDAWSERHEAKAIVTAWNAKDEYQAFRLSQAEVDRAAPVLLEAMSHEARAKVLQNLLAGLSNAKLLTALASDLRLRVKLPNER